MVYSFMYVITALCVLPQLFYVASTFCVVLYLYRYGYRIIEEGNKVRCAVQFISAAVLIQYDKKITVY
jgi:hypothetical protein